MKIKSTIISVLFFIGTANFYVTIAQINTNDSLALVDLYNSTNGSSWLNNNNWLTATRVKSWYGITTYNSRVTKIELSSNSLSGQIPESIGNLTELKVLFLPFNSLTGQIPASIGNLLHLNSLQLDFNQLSNSIPSQLGNLINCTSMSLSNNLLTGSIPSSLGNLKKLEFFQLNTNLLSGIIPESFNNLTNLVNMYLSFNNLTGKVPLNLFRNKKNLSVIDVSHNHVTYYSNVHPGADNYDFSFYANYDNFTFDGIEYLAGTLPGFTLYSEQAVIPVHKSNKMLRVYAGGTLANNTYSWYKKGNGSTPVAVITGDSTFTPTESGRYYAKVTNSIATRLTLVTDTVKYKVESLMAVSIYPNPVKHTLIIKGLDVDNTNKLTVTDISGNILVAGVADKQPIAECDVSKLKPGNYVLNVSNGLEIRTLHFIKE